MEGAHVASLRAKESPHAGTLGHVRASCKRIGLLSSKKHDHGLTTENESVNLVNLGNLRLLRPPTEFGLGFSRRDMEEGSTD